MRLATELEPLIVENGTLYIDSVFRFLDDIESLPAFLGLCQQKKCMVEFELEELICRPGGSLLPKDKDDGTPYDSMFIVSMMAYMTISKQYFGKHLEFLMNLVSKKDNWVQCVREPILVEE